MKTRAHIFTSHLLLTFLIIILSGSAVNCQNKYIWKGGAPGAETDWMQAKNWVPANFPGELDEVVIPSLETKGEHYPIVDEILPAIAKLTLERNAILTINPSGHLHINGSPTYDYGIVNCGIIYDEGQLDISQTALASILNLGTIYSRNNQELLARN